MGQARLPIIILHGWRLSGDRFSPLVQSLTAHGFAVSAPDLPGFGEQKELTHTLTLEDYVDYIVKYIYKNNYKKCIIIGHSFGGRIGILLSTLHPELVRALILTGTPGLPTESTLKRKVFQLAAKTGKAIFSLSIFRPFYAFARKVIYKLSGTWDYYRASGALKETFTNVISYNLAPLLSKLTVPTLLIWGEEDKIVPLNIAQKMKSLIPNSKLISIPSAGHGAPWTNANKFTKEVETFYKHIF